MEAQVEMAIAHHMRCNRHHPEHYADANDMSKVDLIEMVCDWTAMAQEFGQDGGSARGWANKTIGHRVHFNEEKRYFVYTIIDQLDAKLRSSQLQLFAKKTCEHVTPLTLLASALDSIIHRRRRL